MPFWKAPSDFLRTAHARKVTDGALIALRQGKWLNRFITINFDKAKLQSNAWPFFIWYRKQCRDWLAYRDSGSLNYIAVFENKGGFHVHALMHVPHSLWKPFTKVEARWMKSGLEKYDGVYHRDVLRDQPVRNYEKFLQGDASERDYLKQLRRLVLYNLKGATRMDTPDFLGMDEDEKEVLLSTSLPSHQGRVWGRRVTVSQNLVSTSVSPSLHPERDFSWLANAEREARAGTDLHNATIGKRRVRRRTS